MYLGLILSSSCYVLSHEIDTRRHKQVISKHIIGSWSTVPFTLFFNLFRPHDRDIDRVLIDISRLKLLKKPKQ